MRVSTLSLVYVKVPVKATVAGAIYNPTADTVKLAFKPVGQKPTSGDWQTASWETAGSGVTVQYYARCLIGPGGTINLGQGEYVIWVQITDNPEIPVMQASETLVVV